MHDMRRTKAQLIEELGKLRESEARAAVLDLEHVRVLRALRERVKELNCLYGISRVAQNRDLPLEEIIRQVGELVCASWQYPEISCARIRMDGLDITTRNYRQTPWGQKSPILIREEHLGEIEVRYLEARPKCDEGPFLREERHLLDAVAEKLARLAQAARTEAQMRVLSRELIKAQEKERLRIATELHDHLAQDLATLKMDLGGLMEPQAPTGHELKLCLAGLSERLSGAITDIRDLAYDLLPPGAGGSWLGADPGPLLRGIQHALQDRRGLLRRRHGRPSPGLRGPDQYLPHCSRSADKRAQARQGRPGHGAHNPLPPQRHPAH